MTSEMVSIRFGAAAALSLALVAPAPVSAHTELLSTSPPDGENLDDPPAPGPSDTVAVE